MKINPRVNAAVRAVVIAAVCLTLIPAFIAFVAICCGLCALLDLLRPVGRLAALGLTHAHPS